MNLWDRVIEGSLTEGSGLLIAGAAGVLGLLVTALLLRPLIRGISSKDTEKIRRGRLRRITFAFIMASLALLPLIFVQVTVPLGEHHSKILFDIAEFVLVLFTAYGVFEILLGFFADFLPQLRGQPPTSPIFKDITRTIFLAVTFFVAAKVSFPGADIGALVTTSAVFSLVIGLALQESLSNIFSGLMLSIDTPFKPGDWIEVDGREGKVMDSNWRSTRILTRDNDLVYIPNSTMGKSVLINHSVPDPDHLCRRKIGIEYGAQPNKVRTVLVNMMTHVDGVLSNPPPDVFVLDFGDSAVTYEMRFWINDHSKRTRVESEVMRAAWYHLKRNSIGIPFPIRDVYLHQPMPEKGMDGVLSLLDRVDVLTPLAADEKKLLAEELIDQLFAKGEVICRQGDEGRTFYIIKSGRIAVHAKGPDGIEAKVAELQAGNYFGEMSLLTGEPRSSTCIAQDDCEVLCLERETFATLVKQNPTVAESMSEILARRVSATQRRLAEERDGSQRREKPDENLKKGILGKMLSIFGFGKS